MNGVSWKGKKEGRSEGGRDHRAEERGKDGKGVGQDSNR